MFTGTFAANVPLTKQKKYPKVRGRKTAKDVNNEETTDFGYEPLTSLDEQEAYYDRDDDIQCRGEDDLYRNQSWNVKSTGSDYIKKLLKEEEVSKHEHANAEQGHRERRSVDTRNRSRHEKENLRGPHKMEESHHRTLMKENSHFDFSSGRERSRSSDDIGSSFLASVLKDSLFVAQFTLPDAENNGYPSKKTGPSLMGPTICNEHLPLKDVTPKLSISSSFSRVHSKEESRENITMKRRGKENLVRVLQNSIFQPSLLVQNKEQLAASCPDLAQSSKVRNKGPPPAVLARVLNPSRMANAMTSRSKSEILENGEDSNQNPKGKELKWEKVETITRERPLSNPFSPDVSSLVQEALRNSWFAINLQGVIMSAHSSADITPRECAYDEQPEHTAGALPHTSGAPIQVSSTSSTSRNGICKTSEFACQQERTTLPTFVIDMPKAGKDNNDDDNNDDDNNDASAKEALQGMDQYVEHQQYSDDTFTSDLSKSSFHSGDEKGIDSVFNSSSGSPSHVYSNLCEGRVSKDDQTKSIMDVLGILCSMQEETEFSFFEDKCCATGPGLTEGFVDEPATFHLVLMDKPDLLRLMVIIEGPGILQPRTEYTPLTKNIIRVVYWPERVGRYTIRILWKNREIPGSPFKPLVLLPKCEVWVKRVL